ncbi:MAG: hypothetical protein WDO70_06525 [Alphaproteobacteria bacterium]
MPITPPTAQPVPAAIPPALPVQIIDLPAPLQTLAQPAVLEGQLQLVARNTMALDTPLGLISFSLPSLRANPQMAQLLISYISDGAPLQLQLNPASGGPTANLLFQPVTAAAAGQSPAAQGAMRGSIEGTTLQAVVLPANPSANPARPNPSSSMPSVMNDIKDSMLRQAVKLSQQFLQAVTGNQADAPKPPGGAQTSAAPVQNSGPTLPQLNQGQLLNLKIQHVVQPRQPLPELAEGEFAAVVGSSPLGQPIATAGNTSILLKTNAALTPGSTLILKLMSGREDAPIADPAAQSWPALRQLLAQGFDPVAQQNFLSQRMPQMNQALPGAMLFLMSALNQGELRQWLGDKTIGALEKAGKKALLDELQNELRRGAETTTDPTVGNWRVYHLPWQDQGQLTQMHIYVHHNDERQQDQQEKDEKQTRFVIDVTFTRLGVLQLDGFVQQKKFDLMLRSEQPLEQTLRHELQAAFANTLSATGYTGTLLFQQGSQNWLRLGRQGTGLRV